MLASEAQCSGEVKFLGAYANLTACAEAVLAENACDPVEGRFNFANYSICACAVNLNGTVCEPHETAVNVSVFHLNRNI